MADRNPTGRGVFDPGSTDTEDHVVESGVLGFVIEEHPTHLTIPELALVLCRRTDDFGENDAFERAIRELVGAGLLHIAGGLVVPTRAALYCTGLEMSL